jgi:uroporphyrinogen-III synthase
VAPFLSAAHAAGDAKRFPLLAAVGEATARSVGTPVALCAEPARSDVLAQQFPEGSGSVLVVQGNLADNQLSDDIEAKGWTVTRVVAYRTVHLRPTKEMMLPALSADVLLLASGSAATAWFDAFGASTPPYVVAMGPSTAKVAVNLGLEVSAIASEQTLDSLIETAERVISQ